MGKKDDGGIPLKNLSTDIAPDVMAVLFASEWDDAINFFRHATQNLGFTQEMFEEMLDEHKKILEKYIPMPKGLTTTTAQPYVQISDMFALAGLARALYDRLELIPDQE
jgi:ABC-type Fe3+-citrate transport system substrate-binding protein